MSEDFDLGQYLSDLKSAAVESTGYIKPWMKHHDFVLVRTVDELSRIVDKALANGSCALDLETEGLDNRIFYRVDGQPYTVHQVVGFCISIDGKTGYYIPIRHRVREFSESQNLPIEETEQEIKRLCLASQPKVVPGEDPLSGAVAVPPKCVIYFWNAKFDQECLFPITGIDWWHPASFEDGLLCAYVLDTDDDHFDLKFQAEKRLGYEMIELSDLFPKGNRSRIKFAELCPDELGAVHYGASDGICTKALVDRLLPEVMEKHQAIYRLEKQVTQVVRVMERYRLRIDREAVRAMIAPHEASRARLAEKIVAFAESKGWKDFQPTSPVQLAEFLFGDKWMNISPKPPQGKSKQYSTGEEHLNEIAEQLGAAAPEIFKWVLEFRNEEKMLGTYLHNLLNNFDARVSDSSEMRIGLKQTGARTGRFTCPAGEPDQGYSGVPWHGMPKESAVRNCLVARPGYVLVKADYSGQEVCIGANLSGEPLWIKELSSGAGDLHIITARAFFGENATKEQRNGTAKPSLFAVMYGGGHHALMRIDGCNEAEGKRRHNLLKSTYPTYFGYVEKSLVKAKKEAGVYTAFGRWLSIKDFRLKPGDIRNGERLEAQEVRKIEGSCKRFATNGPIQGSGADILKIAMVLLHKAFYKAGWLRGSGDDSVRMIHTVHDELIFEIRQDRIKEALPMISSLMKKPGSFIDPHHSPPWKVSLVAEPQVGLSWGAGYGVAELKDGYKVKSTEVVQNGLVYSLTRRIKDESEMQPYEVVVDKSDKGVIVQMKDLPPWIDPALVCSDNSRAGSDEQTAGTDQKEQDPKEQASPTGQTSSIEQTPKETPAVSLPAGMTAVIRISEVTDLSARQVADACRLARDPAGVLLRLEAPSGAALLDPKKKQVRVALAQFMKSLTECRLTDGACTFV